MLFTFSDNSKSSESLENSNDSILQNDDTVESEIGKKCFLWHFKWNSIFIDL